MIVATQLFFYGMPWISWDGRQAVWFDILGRHFYIFSLVFEPADLLYLTGLLIVSAFGLFWWTTVAGRFVVRLFLSTNRVHRNHVVD